MPVQIDRKGDNNKLLSKEIEDFKGGQLGFLNGFEEGKIG